MGCAGASIVGFVMTLIMIAVMDVGFFGAIGLFIICSMIAFIMVGMVSR